MASFDAVETAGKIYDLTQEPSANVRAEINDALENMSGNDSAALTEALVMGNVLPSLLLEEMGPGENKMDANGDGILSYGAELTEPGADALSQFALDYANGVTIGPKQAFAPGDFTTSDVRDLVRLSDEQFGEMTRPGGPAEVAAEVPAEVTAETSTDVTANPNYVEPAPRPDWLDLAGRTPEAGELAAINEDSLRPLLLGENGEIIDANPMRADWEYEEAAADPTIQLDVSNPEIVEMQHDITPVSELPTPQSILENPTSTPEQQLQAIKDLVASGTPPTSIVDANGNTINVRMEVVPVAEGSDRSYVHMFAVDPATGAEMPILRAVSTPDGFEHQRSADGEEVTFVGTKWKRNNPDTTFGED